jgi:uncharacterized protein GlcG (DUF336 family)
VAELTLEAARAIVATALAGARTAPDKRLAVAVLDGAGHLLAFEREEGLAPLNGEIAQAKAFTCIASRRSLRAFSAWAADATWLEGLRNIASARMGGAFISGKGGVLVRDAEGRLLGAVGISGEQGEQDEKLAIAGIEAAGLVADWA